MSSTPLPIVMRKDHEDMKVKFLSFILGIFAVYALHQFFSWVDVAFIIFSLVLATSGAWLLIKVLKAIIKEIDR